MSEEKQKLMKLIVEGCCEKYGKNSMCNGKRCEYCIADIEVGVLANVLIDAGYRKASEVALEVIGEVEALADKHMKILDAIELISPIVVEGGKHAFKLVLNLLAEFKKKYTEGE